MMYAQVDLVLFSVLLALASSSDVGLRKIPNWITVAIAVTGLVVQATTGGVRSTASGILAGIAILLLFTPFWLKGIIGGGDLKLGVAAGVWVGLARSPRYLLASALAGGVIGAMCYFKSTPDGRHSIRANVYCLHVPNWRRAAEAAEKPVLVPYGVAFAAGALYAIHF